MKKAFLGLLCAASATVYAQDSYFSFQAGYGLGLPGFPTLEITGDTAQSVAVVKNRQIAGGLNASASFGFMSRDNWGLDFGIQYQNQFGQTITDQGIIPVSTPNGVELVTSTTDHTYRGQSIRFTPAVRVQSDGRDFNFFATFGPSVVLNSFSETTDANQGTSSSFVRKEEYNMTLSFGLLATGGIEFELDRDLYFTTALQLAGGYISPSKSEITQFDVNGESILDDLQTVDIETEYERELVDTGAQQDPNSPSKEFRFSYAYNAVNLMVGLRIVL